MTATPATPSTAPSAATSASAARRLLGATAAIGILLVATQLILWSTLPDPVASHFTFAGIPDGYLSRTANLTFGALVVLGIPLLIIAMIRMDRRFTRASRFLGAFGVGIASFIAALMLSVLAAQRGLSDAASVTFPGTRIIPPALVGLALGALMYRLLPTPDPSEPASEPAPVMELAATEQVSWTATQSNHWFLVLSLGFILGGVIALPLTEPALGWILIGVGALLATTFSQVSVTIDQRGVAWRLGIGLFRGHIALDDLTRARSVEVTPTQYGGWGYRFSTKGAAIVMVAGPGITFEREGSQDLTITVPDAATGAAVANGLIARART